MRCQNMSGKELIYEEILVSRFRAYISPIFLAIGIPGNGLSLIVFAVMQHHSPCRFNIYTIALSLVNFIQLIFDTFLGDFLGDGLDRLTAGFYSVNFENKREYTCRGLPFIVDTSTMLIAFILLQCSLDRLYSLYTSKTTKPGQYRTRVCLGIVFSSLASILLFSPHWFAHAVLPPMSHGASTESADQLTCQYIHPHSSITYYLVYMHAIGAVILPTTFIIIVETVIMSKLVRMQKEHAQSVGTRKREYALEISKSLTLILINIIFTSSCVATAVTSIIYNQFRERNQHLRQPKYYRKLQALLELFRSLEAIGNITDFFNYLLMAPFRHTLMYLLSCNTYQMKGKLSLYTTDFAHGSMASFTILPKPQGPQKASKMSSRTSSYFGLEKDSPCEIHRPASTLTYSHRHFRGHIYPKPVFV